MRIVFLLFVIATTASAQQFEIGVRHLIVETGSADNVNIDSARGFAATAEIFVTPHFSSELSASFANPAANLATPDVDLGTLGLQTTALTARWNAGAFFVGAGGAVVSIGNLDDQTGDAIEVDFDREITFVAEAGARLRLRRVPHLAAIVVVSYMPLTAELNVRRANVTLPAELSLDPLVIGVGASWRF